MTSRVWLVERTLADGASAGPILGIDTGSATASLGLVDDGRVRAALSRAWPSHCEGLPAAIDELIATAGLKLTDIKGIGIAIGPGSFTGLRIGLSYAKGLAYARRIPVAGIPTLDAMALAGGSDLRSGTLVCPVIDARRGEVYAALYRFSGDALEKEVDAVALAIEELAGLISGDAILIGAAKAGEVQALAATKGHRISRLESAELSRTGGLVAALAAALIAQNKADDAASLEPLYVRGPGAAARLMAT
jgi:tRNA threonylcarbamoyladenosine biosynthesis protein TsaB